MQSWNPLPAEIYALVERTPGAVLLEDTRRTAEPSVSRLFLHPVRIVDAYALEDIPALFADIENAVSLGNSAAGFFSYECGAAFEPAAHAPFLGQPGTPLAWFGIYERTYTFHHQTGRFAEGDPPRLAPAADCGPYSPPPRGYTDAGPGEEDFAASIAQIHEWIRAGDVYQLNFTYPLRFPVTSSPSALYARLRSRQPVPYGAWLHWRQGQHILSLSPELFFRIEEDGSARRIVTQPMKGTARRGRTTAEDAQIAEGLRHDEKNRAENVMIVDLLRNDLGRLCIFGSVQVKDLFAVERYPTLWQMTSTVKGTLRPGVDFYDVFGALFPCGSVTGAPKVRAMQLLAQLEARPRGVYTGAIGFFSPQSTVFNIAIRTLELRDSEAVMGVGSGIVIDSGAADEFRECQLKAEFLTREQEPFSLVETMLWHDGCALLSLHLERMQDSAAYFDFSYDRAAICAALHKTAAAFPRAEPRRVRLLLDPGGAFRIEHEAVSLPQPEPLRICLVAQRTDTGDRFLYHKTTHRPLYAKAFATATAAGFADAIFLNQRGEVTEGAISNLFVERGRRWYTPPVACGLLAGVYRRHLLVTRPAIEERILHLDDLRNADAIYLANAVRGLRLASLASEI